MSFNDRSMKLLTVDGENYSELTKDAVCEDGVARTMFAHEKSWRQIAFVEESPFRAVVHDRNYDVYIHGVVQWNAMNEADYFIANRYDPNAHLVAPIEEKLDEDRHGDV